MTLASDVIGAFPVLRAVFDPADSDFRALSQIRDPFETAVLSMLSGRRIFWITHALVFGYAVDIEGSRFDDGGAGSEAVGPGKYRQLFGAGRFDYYVDESGHKDDYDRLLETATVLDSLLNAHARAVAMRGTVAINQCIQRCRGDSDCVRRCIAGENRYG